MEGGAAATTITIASSGWASATTTSLPSAGAGEPSGVAFIGCSPASTEDRTNSSVVPIREASAVACSTGSEICAASSTIDPSTSTAVTVGNSARIASVVTEDVTSSLTAHDCGAFATTASLSAP